MSEPIAPALEALGSAVVAYRQLRAAVFAALASHEAGDVNEAVSILLSVLEDDLRVAA